jgi:hypothetical protein
MGVRWRGSQELQAPSGLLGQILFVRGKRARESIINGFVGQVLQVSPHFCKAVVREPYISSEGVSSGVAEAGGG